MEQYQSDFRTDAQSRGGNSVLAENSSFSLGTCALSEVRKLEPAKPQIEPGALKAVNEELDKVSSIKTDWANCRDAESGMRAEISKSSFDTMVEFDKTSDTGDKGNRSQRSQAQRLRGTPAVRCLPLSSVHGHGNCG